jgi:D-alanyl-D-alanine dipeptidase
VTRGRRATLSGVLTTSGGRPVAGRTVTAWWRAADIGTWRSWSLRTDAQGRVSRRVGDRPNLQYTLRFAGDARYGRAASAALVPAPSATGLSPALVRGLARARAAARRAGIGLVVNSGYRTWARQQAWYDAAVRRYGSPRAARLWVLPPEESTHVRGLAIDVGPPATAAWLARNGARFGFCRTYANEAWHFEYRPRWVRASGGRCPAPVAVPGDPDPLSPRPRVPVR